MDPIEAMEREALGQRKRLHEAEQGLSKRQIVALVAMHAFLVETPDDFINKYTKNLKAKDVIDTSFAMADEFLRR